MAFVARTLGRAPARWLARQVGLVFALARREIRSASRDYLTRVGVNDGHPRLRHVVRHVRTFAEVILDRIFLLRGEFERFEITRHGSTEIRSLRSAERGALLVGAHFGSFEAMRAIAQDHDIRINIVAHHDNAKKINALLDSVAVPRLRARVVEIRTDDPGHILELKELVDRGELVAMLGDRVGLTERAVEVELLGARARVPAGPWIVASILRCPVALVFGAYSPPRRYDVHLEPFADPVILPRAGRDAALQAVAQRYADRLEAHLREHPYNWFNFFPFWSG